MKRKWTKARRARYEQTIAKRNHKPGIKQSSHFYRLKGTELIPVKVRKVVAWVIE